MDLILIIHSLNEYAGLFSLLAVIAAIIVPIAIYKKGRSDERQALQDELDALEDNSRYPMPMDMKNYFTRKSMLEKRLKR